MQNKNLKHSPGIHYPLGEPVTMENGMERTPFWTKQNKNDG